MLDAEKVRRDLRDLWDSLGREHEGGVLRACALTLIVVAKDQSDAEAVRQTLGIVMHRHPSRAFVVRIDADSREPEAHVFAECWMPFGRHQQICAEGVEISAAALQLPEVARVLSPLRVADLPSIVWLRSDHDDFDDESFAPIFDLADKVILDSTTAEWDDAIRSLRTLRNQGRRIADLAWTSITGWRETLSHLVEDGLLDPNAIRRVHLSHGGERPDPSVRYFATWMRNAVPNVETVFERQTGDAGLLAIRIEGSGAEVSLSLRDGPSLDVRVADHHDYSPLPPDTLDALLDQELNLLRPDSVFDKVLAG